jgi:hypothetical protein
MQELPPFSVPRLIALAKCDVCGQEGLCVYTPEIEKWMCGECVRIVTHLMQLRLIAKTQLRTRY